MIMIYHLSFKIQIFNEMILHDVSYKNTCHVSSDSVNYENSDGDVISAVFWRYSVAVALYFELLWKMQCKFVKYNVFRSLSYVCR